MKKENFDKLKKLCEFLKENNMDIEGCGCCESPYVTFTFNNDKDCFNCFSLERASYLINEVGYEKIKNKDDINLSMIYFDKYFNDDKEEN